MLCFELTDSSARGWIISDSLSGKQTAESYTTSKHQVNLASERWHHIYKANAGTFRLASGLELAEKLSGFLEPAVHVLVGSCVNVWKENLGNWTLDRFPFIMLFDGTQTRYPLSGMPNTALMYNTSGRQQCAKLWDKQTEDTGRLNCCGSS